MLNISNLGLRSFREVNIQVDITKLYCSDNELETLEGLEKCINLTELDCSYNNIKTLEELEKYINLTELYCSNNELSLQYNLVISTCILTSLNDLSPKLL